MYRWCIFSTVKSDERKKVMRPISLENLKKNGNVQERLRKIFLSLASCVTGVSTENNRDQLRFEPTIFYPLIGELTDFKRTFFSKIKNCKNYFQIYSDFFFFRKLTEFQPNFFSNIKKSPKLFLKFFSNFFLFEKFFSIKIFFNFFFRKVFFSWQFLLSNFLWRKFFFSQKYFCDDFFNNIFGNFLCIWYLRNFAYCEFFYFAILVYGKKNCKFFLQFFYQRWTWIPNLKMFLFWKKVKCFAMNSAQRKSKTTWKVPPDIWNKKLFVCIKVYHSVLFT